MLFRREIILALLLYLSDLTAQSDTAQVIVSSGWNLLSLPVAVSDPRTSTLFPSALSQAFTFQHGYSTHDTLHPGIGYWMKFPDADTIEIVGIPITYDTLNLNAGWHMIGSLGIPISSGDVTTTPTNIINSLFFRFDSETGYNVADSLVPGNGYWVKLAVAGKLNQFACASPSQLLVFPADNGGTATSTRLVWRRSRCATDFRVQLATDSLFVHPVADTTFSDTLYFLPKLDSAQVYYWRLAIHTSYGLILWSEIRTFIVAWKYLALGDEEISVIRFDKFDTNLVYAGSRSDFSLGKIGGVFRSTDRGVSWDTLLRGISASDIQIHPYDTRVMYVVSTYNYISEQGIFKTLDGGTTWAKADSGLPYIEAAPSFLNVDPENPETLYTGVSTFGAGIIYKSMNGGEYWYKLDFDTSSTLDISISAMAIDHVTPSTVYFSTSQDEIYKTYDRGLTFQKFPFPGSGVFDMIINARSPESLYVGAWTGFYKSADSGKTWQQSDSGLVKDSSLFIDQIQMNPITRSHLYLLAGTYNTGVQLFHSVDHGTSWHPIRYSFYYYYRNYNYPIYTMNISVDGKKLWIGLEGIYKYLLNDL